MLVRLIACLMVLALLPSAAWAAKRVALVIGNSAYQHTPKLTNPKNDATDMVVALKKHGFHVVEGYDLDKAALDRKIRDFAVALTGAEVGLFFYAGHGLQVAGHNYIVPVDAQLTTASALDFEMVRVDLVHRTMEREAQTNILFLDACRDNPLARNLARAMGTRSADVGKGLAPIESGVGTLISFSTQPGNVALDGSGRNSPFAGALVKQLSSPTDDLSAILIAVRNDVMKETQRKQVPWEHSALTGRFYFSAPPSTSPAVQSSQSRMSEAAEAWNAVKDATDAAVVEAFITRYRSSFFAELAQSKLDDLKKQQAAARATEEAERTKATAEAQRVCANAANVQNIQVLTALAEQHKGSPAATCIAERIEALKKQQQASQSPTPEPGSKRISSCESSEAVRKVMKEAPPGFLPVNRDPCRLEKLGLILHERNNTIVITDVEKGSDAEAKKLNTGEVIAEVNGEAVKTIGQVLEQVGKNHKLGRKAILFKLLQADQSMRYVPVAFRAEGESTSIPKAPVAPSTKGQTDNEQERLFQQFLDWSKKAK